MTISPSLAKMPAQPKTNTDMTKDETIEKINAIDNGDIEIAHVEADSAILDFLRDNGFADVAAAWEALEKRCDGFWYA